MFDETPEQWTVDVFGDAELGDSRRTSRLVTLAKATSTRPAGKSTEVCKSSATRQGAYDLLNNPAATSQALVDALSNQTARLCNGNPFTFVAIDGTSLTLTDRKKNKGFGAIGSTLQGAQGLKVISALAMNASGSPLGLLDQRWWIRKPHKRRRDCHKRPIEKKKPGSG